MLYAIDFDETLNKSSLDKVYNPNYKLISFLRDKAFFILTARDDVEYNRQYIDDFLKSNLLFPKCDPRQKPELPWPRGIPRFQSNPQKPGSFPAFL